MNLNCKKSLLDTCASSVWPASPICCSWNLHTIFAKHFTLANTKDRATAFFYSCHPALWCIIRKTNTWQVTALPWTSMLWSSRCKNTHMQQVHRKKWGRLFHNVVHSPHIEPPIVSRKLGKLSFADEHRGPHIDRGRQLFHNFESSEIPNKHTASERRLPVVTSENAARKVPTKYMEMPKFWTTHDDVFASLFSRNGSCHDSPNLYIHSPAFIYRSDMFDIFGGTHVLISLCNVTTQTELPNKMPLQPKQCTGC